MVRVPSLTIVTLALGLLFVGVALGSEDVDVSSCAADSTGPQCQSDDMGSLQLKAAVTIATPCQTTDAEACTLPFKYKGTTFDRCTSADGDQPWCATGTDAHGGVAWWGKCAGSCSVTAPEICTTKSSLTTKAEACAFPFKYQDVMHNSCISKDNDRLWCATQADKTGAYTSWGDCGSCAAQAAPNPATKQKTTIFAIVDELYTYGPPAAGEVLEDLSHANGCFPGMRSYTEDLHKWAPTQVDFASVATPFRHARTGTLVLHWNSDSWYISCPGKKSWPLGLLDKHAPLPTLGIHAATKYQDRVQHNTGSVLDSAQHARALLCVKMAQLPYPQRSLAYPRGRHDIPTIKNIMLKETPGWTLVAFHAIVGYAGRMVKDKDGIVLTQNQANLECVLAFAGSDAALDLITSVSSSSTSFCGFSPVHRGFTEEIWSLTHTTQYQTDIKPKLGKCSKVIVVGHSLGGAIAEVFAACVNSGRTKDIAYQQMIWTKGTAEQMSEI